MSRGRPRSSEVPDVDNPQLTRTSVLDNGLIGPKPRTNSQAKYTPDGHTSDSLYALNTLQQKFDTPLNDSVLYYAVAELIHSLPPIIVDAVYTGGQPGVEDMFGLTEGDFRTCLEMDFPEDSMWFDNAKACPFIMWPLNAGNSEYATLIMINGVDPEKEAEREALRDDPRRTHARGRNRGPEYSRVLQWSIAEPLSAKDPDGAAARVKNQGLQYRIWTIFEQGGYDFEDAQYMGEDAQYMGSEGAEWHGAYPTVPMQDDDWSSGIRCFNLIREQLRRLTEQYCSGLDFNYNHFWDNQPGWLNVHLVRYEMLGLLSISCISHLEYNARIAIEPIHMMDGPEDEPAFRADDLFPDSSITGYNPKTGVEVVPHPFTFPLGDPEEDEEDEESDF